MIRRIILIVTILTLAAIAYGLWGNLEAATANRFIGFGTATLFLLIMPAFIFSESKGKNMKDYMLNQENILKMKKHQKEE